MKSEWHKINDDFELPGYWTHHLSLSLIKKTKNKNKDESMKLDMAHL